MATRRKARRPWRRHAPWILGAAGIGLAVAGILLWPLYRQVDEFVRDRSPAGVRVYSDSFAVRLGQTVEAIGLLDRLRRLGYREAETEPLAPGEFRARPDRIDVARRAFRDADGVHDDLSVTIEVERGTSVRIRRVGDGADLEGLRLEPELIGSYAGGVLGERRSVPLREFPRHVVSAVLAVEDARFASHPGIDPVGLFRAAWVNLRGGGVRQGGSTITQQLAKNVFLTPERSWRRKILEIAIAFVLEARLSKEEILEAYLNSVYLGRSDAIAINGIAQGARAFFAKEPRELTVAEGAVLAGIIHSPNADSPLRHADRARIRRDLVLDLMAENAWLSRDELERWKREPVRIARGSNQPLEAPFFVDEVLRRVEKIGYQTGLVRGLSVYTALDLDVQHECERALASGLERLERGYKRLARAETPLEGAAVVLEAGTGYVRGLAGGRDFGRSQFNRVTRSRRQPGSAFKPFVYLAAIDDPDNPATPATLLRDEPMRLRVGNQDWSPTNYDGHYLGEVTVRTALEGSRNVPTVVLAERVGPARIAGFARMLGLGVLPAVPSLALGVGEVAPVDLVGAYSVFPNLGRLVRPALIKAVVAEDGVVLYADQLRTKRVATAPASYVVSRLLEGVIDEGTGAGVRRLGVTGAVAGKTGTTNDAKDAWFVGYSPDLVAGVWVGFDDGTPVGLSGAQAALPIWASFMKEALRAYPDRAFEIPPGVVFQQIERSSGLVASASCSDTIREAFVVGTAPVVTCDGERVGEGADRAPPGEREPSRPGEKRPSLLDRIFGGF